MNNPTAPLRRVAVFCGSAFGNNPAFRAEATALGAAIARAGLGLVYGGACRGLMGAVADAALAAGGEVIRVLPHALKDRKIAHNGLTSLELVSTMHERKARIHELSDVIFALPGGYGTLDELPRGDHLGADRPACRNRASLSIRPTIGTGCSPSSTLPWPQDSSRLRIASWCAWPRIAQKRSPWR